MSTDMSTFWSRYRWILGHVAREWSAERLVEEALEGTTASQMTPPTGINARLDASVYLDCRMLLFATAKGQLSVVRFLVIKGADLEARCPHDLCFGLVKLPGGIQAVNVATLYGKLDVLEVLLTEGAGCNAPDHLGRTPLMGAFCCISARSTVVEMVRLLLRQGGNPGLEDGRGRTCLHWAALSGADPDVLSLLAWKARSKLNHADHDGKTPLYYAADSGNERAVRRLLYAGANNGNNGLENCPLSAAVSKGHENAVSVLLEDGIEAIGGDMALNHSIAAAIKSGRTRLLHEVMSAVEGNARYVFRFAYWAKTLLYHAAGFGNLGASSLLLAEGLYEEGCTAAVGSYLPPAERDPQKEAAIGRMLQRGPAFRATSWLWADGRNAPLAAAGASPVMLSSGPALGVRFFRPTDRKFFLKLIGRHAKKR